MRRVVALAGVLAVGGLLPLAPSSEAHAGGSFCDTILEIHPFGNPDAQGLRGSHSEGECVASYQGTPGGVVGTYDAGRPDLPAEIHVVATGITANGTRIKLAECEAKGFGVVSCEDERNPLDRPLTLPEPLPQPIVRVVCEGHSHARVLVDDTNTPAGRFGCYTTDEAEAELRDDLADGGEDPPAEEPTAEDAGAGDEPGPGGPTAAGAPIVAVPFDTYATAEVLARRDGVLTFVNGDAANHDVVARVRTRPGNELRPDHTRPDGSAPWCATASPGECPLFWSELIGGPGATTPVLGLADATVGTTYEFTCSIHPWMSGRLTVVG